MDDKRPKPAAPEKEQPKGRSRGNTNRQTQTQLPSPDTIANGIHSASIGTLGSQDAGPDAANAKRRPRAAGTLKKKSDTDQKYNKPLPDAPKKDDYAEAILSIKNPTPPAVATPAEATHQEKPLEEPGIRHRDVSASLYVKDPVYIAKSAELDISLAKHKELPPLKDEIGLGERVRSWIPRIHAAT